MNVLTAKRLAQLELTRFPELADWKVETSSRMNSTNAVCVYNKKTIVLSEKYVLANDQAMVNRTILHEIAHALTPGHHHDHVWKAKARELGIPDTTRNGDCNEVRKKFGAVCPNCQRVLYSNRPLKKGKEAWCGKCGRFKGRLSFVLVA